MKAAKACRECRLKKRKCTIDPVPGAPRPWSCTPCIKRGIQTCSLATRESAVSSRQPPIAPARPKSPEAMPVDDHGLDQETRLELVDLYLRLIHDKPHTLFHPASLRQRARDGSISNQVLLGIMAMAAPFARHPEVTSRAPFLVNRAKDALKADMETMSLDNVRAAVLVGNLCGAHGNPDAEMLYFGIAFRIAQIIRLPDPAPEDNEIEREVKLRTWWSLYMIDRWSSAGTSLRRQLPDETRHPLPMDELQFYELHDSAEHGHSRPGLWGRMVQLVDVFGAIQDLHRRHVEGEDNAQLELQTTRLHARLEAWAESLPPDVASTPGNLERHARRGLGSAFVALHLGYHHYTTLLCFPFLDLQFDKTESQLLFASRCRYHAAAFSDLLSLAGSTDGCEAVYLVVAHMTTVSSAALLHILMFGSQEDLPKARARLEANFQLLVKLRRFWPAVELMMERLFTFQRACMSSVDPNTHKVDRWMAKFLLQHSLPIPEKTHSLDDGRHPSQLSERNRVATDALSMLRP